VVVLFGPSIGTPLRPFDQGSFLFAIPRHAAAVSNFF
jgi:hypothetical protein